MSREDEDADVGVAEHGELLGLLEEPGSALAEGDLPVHLVLDLLQLNLATSHMRSGTVGRSIGWQCGGAPSESAHRQPPTSLN